MIAKRVHWTRFSLPDGSCMTDLCAAYALPDQARAWTTQLADIELAGPWSFHGEVQRDGQFNCGTYTKSTLYNFMKELKNGH